MSARIGVDVGGTFTDLIAYDPERDVILASKGRSTPHAPELAVLALVRELPEAFLANTEFFLHGTTVGLNALIERKGGTVGLLTTRGFRDVLELRRGERTEMFNLHWRPDPPLVPRSLRLEVAERVRADGSVETALTPGDVLAALEIFRSSGVDSIAVVLINAHASPAHELAVHDILRSAGFVGDIALSHRVSGEYREYERTSTTVIDAYVRPRVAQYLERLADGLTEIGIQGQLMVTRSGGGAMTFEEAVSRPFETIMSGPVAGAIGVGELAQQLGVGFAVMADVGGTSFDTCLILDGHAQAKHEGMVAGMPLQCPWIDVRSIGAGGGSIASIDTGGLLRAGPQSAGADPGPACYDRGGEIPTATDAACALGMLGPGRLAGGLRLRDDLALRSLEPAATALGTSVQHVAQGILRILAASMANAIRSVTIEQGHDPRDAALVAFGGAGPLFACLLMDELEAAEAIIPPYAGNFSALGLLSQDIARTNSVTFIRPLTEDTLLEANDRVLPLGGRRPLDDIHAEEATLEIRYQGQEHTLPIRIPLQQGGLKVSADAVAGQFATTYQRTYGHTLPVELELVTLRHTRRVILPKVPFTAYDVAADANDQTSYQTFSFTKNDTLRFALRDRSSLEIETEIQGPAILTEPTTTIYLDAGYLAHVDPTGALRIRRSSSQPGEYSG